MNITDYILNDFTPLDVQKSISDVQNMFSQTSYSHIPIYNNQNYLGCINENDTHCLSGDKIISEVNHMLEPFFVRLNTSWLDILEAFGEHSSNIMPVLDNSGHYKGYYELEDVMHFFNSIPFMSEEGHVIIIEKNAIDFTYSEICQIIESNGGHILGIFTSDINSNSTQISIKIGFTNFTEIIASFRRYGYQIISTHQEDTFLSNLQERSKYLDKYLNI